jgi:hypothetical protein
VWENIMLSEEYGHFGLKPCSSEMRYVTPKESGISPNYRSLE